MNDDKWDPWTVTEEGFRKNDLPSAEGELERHIANHKSEAFKSLIGARFSNPRSAIFSKIDEFIVKCENHFSINAVYLEMNGFDINADRWFFDFFGYETYSTDPVDLDWLCDWQSPEFPDCTLTGLEEGQAEFRYYADYPPWKHKNPDALYRQYDELLSTAVNLILCKFVLLIDEAVHSGTLSKPVPVLATANEFDPIGRFEPKQK